MIEPARPRWLSFVFAVPVLAVMVQSLVADVGRIGAESAVSGEVASVVILDYLLMVLLVLVWCFSTFRHRTPVLLAQLAVVWTGGLLYAFEVRVDITWWDVAEEVFFMVTTLVQLVPGQRRRRHVTTA